MFVGYGFQINEKELKWDDYANIDVKDKWVIVMRHSPGEIGHTQFAAKHSPLHKNDCC